MGQGRDLRELCRRPTTRTANKWPIPRYLPPNTKHDFSSRVFSMTESSLSPFSCPPFSLICLFLPTTTPLFRKLHASRLTLVAISGSGPTGGTEDISGRTKLLSFPSISPAKNRGSRQFPPRNLSKIPLYATHPALTERLEAHFLSTPLLSRPRLRNRPTIEPSFTPRRRSGGKSRGSGIRGYRWLD